MRLALRITCLALCLAMAGQPSAVAQARSRRVLGVVVQADRAHLDNGLAQLGANVYSCDRLETEPNGVLRIKVGVSQLFLSQSSLATLEDDGNEIQALARGGTIGFSFSAPANFSVRTPAGIIRGAGGRTAAGQLTYASSDKLVISAIQGDLTLDSGGELRSIPEGKSAEVTFDSSSDDRCRDQAPADQSSMKQPYAQRKIAFFLIMGGAAAISGYFLWHDVAESDSKPSQ
jgi:hypothetical protein